MCLHSDISDFSHTRRIIYHSGPNDLHWLLHVVYSYLVMVIPAAKK